MNDQPSKLMEEAVRTAEHLCPSDLPHLNKIRWKAKHIENWLTAAPGVAVNGRQCEYALGICSRAECASRCEAHVRATPPPPTL